MLPRLVPRAVALEMLYTGEQISAARALELGLVNRVVPKTDLARETEQLCTVIAANAPLTLRRYKEMALKGWELPIASACGSTSARTRTRQRTARKVSAHFWRSGHRLGGDADLPARENERRVRTTAERSHRALAARRRHPRR